MADATIAGLTWKQWAAISAGSAAVYVASSSVDTSGSARRMSGCSSCGSTSRRTASRGGQGKYR